MLVTKSKCTKYNLHNVNLKIILICSFQNLKLVTVSFYITFQYSRGRHGRDRMVV
jgi:hypothetical protein